jgi:hypothetical protein
MLRPRQRPLVGKTRRTFIFKLFFQHLLAGLVVRITPSSSSCHPEGATLEPYIPQSPVISKKQPYAFRSDKCSSD